MARRRLIESPPPAASSSDEEGEDESSSEEEEEGAAQDNTIKTQQNKAVKEQNGKGDSGEDEEEDEEGDEHEDDDDDDDEEDEQKAKPNQTAVTTKSDSDSTDTESSQPPSPSVSDFTIKPISPKTKPKPVRKSESKKEMEVVRNDKKPAKRGPSSGTGSSRLWSDDDEIVILNGMIEYQKQKGKNPLADCNDFHEFVKESLHVDASNNQFSDKLRRLKKKYYTALEKNENGKDEIFTKQHDLDCVKLAKKIWGAVGIGSAKSKIEGRDGGSGGAAGSGGITLALAKGDVNGEKRELSVKKQKRVASEEANGEGKEGNVKNKKRGSNENVDKEGKEMNVKKQKRVLTEEVSAEKQKRVVNEMNGGRGELLVKNKVVGVKEVDGREERNEDLSGKYPCLLSSFESIELTGGAKETAIVMLGMVEKEKLMELEREWRALMQVKLEVAVKEKTLVSKQIRLALDASKSQD